jgi:hypothetical protein
MIQVNEDSLTEVRPQLEEILACSFFRTSKRCSRMLRYVVEYSLDHPGGSLKERTIGSEVFDREPDYDPSENHNCSSSCGRDPEAPWPVLPSAFQGTLFISLPPGPYLPAIAVARSGQNGYPTRRKIDRLRSPGDRLKTRRLPMFSHPLEL